LSSCRPEVKFIDSNNPFRTTRENIKDVRPLYGISENGHQNLEEYLRNKLKYEQKNITLAQQKNPKMKTMALNPTEFPTLSTEPKLLDEILENLPERRIPAKRKSQWKTKCGERRCWKWTCRHRAGSNLGNGKRGDPLTEHNRKMLQKMKEQNIPWAESYPENFCKSNREKIKQTQ
jgi:hypothetical protein